MVTTALNSIGVKKVVSAADGKEALSSLEAASADGYHRYGQTEWEDLAAAIQYALDHGAEDVVLVGYSMGGAIVVSLLYRSPLAQS